MFLKVFKWFHFGHMFPLWKTEWFQSGFGKKAILKICIESLKTACEGVPSSLKFQVRNLQLYWKSTLSQTCLKFRLRGESRYILWGMWGKPYSWGRGLLGESEGVEETMVFNISFDQKMLIDWHVSLFFN